MPGISIITNFDVNQSVPIDSRIVATGSVQRDAILYKYVGLKVYQIDVKRTFTWNGIGWDPEGFGIYGGSGSIVGDTFVNFGTVSNTIANESYDFVYQADMFSSTNKTYLYNNFVRHSTSVAPFEFRGIEYRTQFKYFNGINLVDSSYISLNAKPGASGNFPGAIAFSTGFAGSSAGLSERMRISYEGKVGIGTDDPREFLQIGTVSGAQKPLVFHNSGSAVIGYNWYFSGTDQFFDVSEGSSKISQDNGSVTIQTRPSGAIATNYTSTLHVGSNGRVGVRTTSPGAILDVVGNIRSSTDTQAGRDILATRDVSATRDVKAGRNIETTDGYFFKNSPTVSIQSLPGILDLNVGGNVFKSNGTKNYLYLQTELVDQSLLIRNSNFTNFQRYQKGIILEAAYSTDGSGIFHYQGDQANNEMGVSVVDFFNTYTRESIRTSEGGKRVQIGVPSSVTTNHSFDHTNTNNSQIDTKNDMFSTNNSLTGLTPVQGANLISSGSFNQISYSWTDNDNGQGYTVNIYQQWQRVGRVVTVHFQIDPVGPYYRGFEFSIPVPILGGSDYQGLFSGLSAPQSTQTIPGPFGIVSGRVGGLSNFVYILRFDSLNANYFFYKQVNGSYTYILP